MIRRAQGTDRVLEPNEMEPFSLRKCPRCNSLYSTTFPESNSRTSCRLPLLLSCGHGICYGCVKGVFLKRPAASHSIVCANCLEKTEITDFQLFQNVISLIHWYLLGLTHLSVYELVNRCNRIGFKSVNTSYSSASTVSTSSEQGKMKCPEHKKALTMWCLFDKEVVCSGCISVGKHKGHHIVSLEEHNSMAIAELEVVTRRSKEVQEKLSVKFSVFDCMNHSLKNEYSQATEQVRVKYAVLHGILLKQERETHKLLESELKSRTKYFKELGLQFRKITSQLGDLIRESEAMIENMSVLPVCVTELTEKLESMMYTSQQALNKLTLITSHKKGPKLVTNPLYEGSLKSTDGPLIVTESVQDVEVVFESDTPTASVTKRPVSDAALGHRVQSVGETFSSGSSFVGCVSFVKGPNRFYMQPLREQHEDFVKMQRELQAQGPATALELSAGMLVAARYQVDRVWYRAIVERIEPEGPWLCFIDYGNKELVPLEAIRPLDKRHHSLPAQAVLCYSLDNRKHDAFDRACRIDFETIVEDRILGADVVDIRRGGVGRCGDQLEFKLYVTLYECEQGPANSIGAPPSATREESTTEKPSEPVPEKSPAPSLPDPPASVETPAPPLYVPPLISQENVNKVRVQLLSMESPGCFFLRRTSKEEAYLTLRRQLDEYYRLHRPVLLSRSDLSVGGMYVVQWSIESNWERCVVTAMDPDSVHLTLVDCGVRVKVTDRSIYRLDERWWDNADAKSLHCSLWGLKPAGGGQTWSRTSIERTTEMLKMGNALFIEPYDVANDVHFVRLYFEYVKQGEGLGCDTAETSCLNDELLDQGLALRLAMPVSKELRIPDWLPALPLPKDRSFQADPMFVDDSATIYLHLPGQSSAVLSKMSALLNAYFAKSAPSVEDLFWKPGQPCIVKRKEDKTWYRARVIRTDDEAQTCVVQFVDYGDFEERTPYTNMRKTLLCATYPVQAARCFLSQLNGLQRPLTATQVDTLHRAVVEKPCTVRVIDSDRPVPLVTMTISDASSTLPAVIENIKLECGGAESEEVGGAFQDPYQPLAIPLGSSVPVKILSVMENMLAVIQPLDCEDCAVCYEWRKQVQRYTRHQRELQLDAPSFVLMSRMARGSPCAVLSADDNLWHRGTIDGRCEDRPSQFRVRLVDLDHLVTVDASSIRELPKVYLNLNRHSATICLKENPSRPFAYYMDKLQPFDGPDCRSFWACFEPEGDREAAHPIAHLMYRKENGQLFMIF